MHIRPHTIHMHAPGCSISHSQLAAGQRMMRRKLRQVDSAFDLGQAGYGCAEQAVHMQCSPSSSVCHCATGFIHFVNSQTPLCCQCSPWLHVHSQLCSYTVLCICTSNKYTSNKSYYSKQFERIKTGSCWVHNLLSAAIKPRNNHTVTSQRQGSIHKNKRIMKWIVLSACYIIVLVATQCIQNIEQLYSKYIQ